MLLRGDASATILAEAFVSWIVRTHGGSCRACAPAVCMQRATFERVEKQEVEAEGEGFKGCEKLAELTWAVIIFAYEGSFGCDFGYLCLLRF